jgi:hypothetical protein
MRRRNPTSNLVQPPKLSQAKTSPSTPHKTNRHHVRLRRRRRPLRVSHPPHRATSNSPTAPSSDDEPAYEDYEAEPEYLDQELDEDVGGGEDPDSKDADDRHVINSGDAAAAAAAATATATAAGQKRKAAAADGRNTVEEVKARRIPNDKRTTTPYMTKYERARVLGTRALQIR